jgi:hypothetical protein
LVSLAGDNRSDRRVEVLVPGIETAEADARIRTAAFQAFLLFRIGFTVAPILFGIDKFFNWTVHWPDYLAGWINDIMPGTAQEFMYFVGAVEIAAGLIVAVAPRLGGPIVVAWLAGIVINLLTNIALRDFGLFLAALTLSRLAWALRPSPARATERPQATQQHRFRHQREAWDR